MAARRNLTGRDRVESKSGTYRRTTMAATGEGEGERREDAYLNRLLLDQDTEDLAHEARH